MRVSRLSPSPGKRMHLEYDDARPTFANAYLWPVLEKEIAARPWTSRRAFDLGCGSGATSALLTRLGFETTGVDPSPTGVAQARAHHPGIRFETGSAYDDLPARHGVFDLVVSLEVIEHCIDPRAFMRSFLGLIAEGGVGVLSTPYHGYLKNLAIALAGGFDRHFTALWDGGHVKFFSIATLRTLLAECGAPQARFLRVGRIPPFARSMLAIVERPPGGPPATDRPDRRP